jgi:putative ABC transport system ATP-binding protein
VNQRLTAPKLPSSPDFRRRHAVASAAPLFSVHNLTKTYQLDGVEVHALRGVDAVLNTGELAVMLGPSGSGKSTFLNILGGLDAPSAGSVMFRDRDIARLSERDLTRYRRNSVGFVFQFYNLIPSLTALENVALVTEVSQNPMPPKEALALVGLSDRMGHFPAQMSGGEQQRVAIARAIAKRPEVMLCDEPTGALDSKTGLLVLEALAKTNRELGTTTAIITHNAAIGGIGDRVFTFRDGAVSQVVENAVRVKPSEVHW